METYKKIAGMGSKVTLENVMIAVAKFSDKTFGKDRPYTAPLHHLKKEVEECIENPTMEEFADQLLLLMDAYRKAHPGESSEKLLLASMAKIKVCEGREWQAPDQNGVCELVREPRFICDHVARQGCLKDCFHAKTHNYNKHCKSLCPMIGKDCECQPTPDPLMLK